MARRRHNRTPKPAKPGKTLPAARQAALDALSACLRGQDAQAAADQALSRPGKPPLDSRDAALATELIYGTLRHKLRLDYILSRFLKKPDGLPAPMRLALAVAAYEILHLDKVPHYASVDWATEYVKTVISPRLATVCNGTLRNVARLGDAAGEDAFYREGARDEIQFLARRHACPEWLARLWCEQYEDAAPALLAASCQAPPLGLRFRFTEPGARERHTALAAAPECVAATATGVALNAPPDDLAELLARGAAVRQSLSGQQAMHALGAADWPRPVWDACCGRGGKSFLLADAAPGTIFASDPHWKRLNGLAAEARRLEAPTVAPFRARADRFAPRTPLPAVLLDAPCTGLGVLSRRPDAKLHRTAQDVTDLAAVQRRILDSASRHVAPGGVLAYVTCTLTRQENAQQIERFLKDHSEFTLGTTHATPPGSPLGEFFYGALLHRA